MEPTNDNADEAPASNPAPDTWADDSVAAAAAAADPLALWYAGGNPLLLRDLLDAPVFRRALATMAAVNAPTGALLRDEAVNARTLAWLAGYHDALRDLRKLAVLRAPEGDGGPPVAAAWDHVAPPPR